jgi:hypothetical protein
MNKKTVIGLAGVKTSGKSTVANIIKELLNENIKETALAGKLKDISAKAFGLTRNYFDDQDLKEVPFEDGPKILTLDIIEDILLSFNTLLTKHLIDKYKESNVIDMPLETPRKIAQVVGTEVLRATGNEDIHCENMPLNEDGITIVSDLRFPNEFDYFSNNENINFIPLYIQRDIAEALVTENSHASETSVFKFSYKCEKVPNNSNLENLKISLEEHLILSGLLPKKAKEA